MQTAHQISDLPAKPKSVNRKALQGAALKYASQLFPGLVLWLYRSHAIFRSALDRIWFGFSTMGERVDLGPSVQFQNGCYVPNVRTRARAEGIGKMLAMRPTGDNLDLRIFLMGFDAGEEYSRGVRESDQSSPNVPHERR